jgi:5-methylcytosine-specific restriction endonuclease McrA
MKEIWKPLFVKGRYFRTYKISNNGRIINIISNKEVNYILNRGIYCVNLYENKELLTIQVHRAVAETFLENKENYSFVLFKDGDKSNLNVSNLFWCSNKRGLSDEEILKQKREKRCRDVARKRKYMKERAVQYKGGKCLICNYNRCLTALEFHHLDPTVKDFAPTDMYSKSWKTVLKELDKCVLLCSNCHREVESKFVSYNLKEMETLRIEKDK